MKEIRSSPDSSDSDSKKNNSGLNSGATTPPEDLLDGDDVPLVEEVLGEMLESDDSQEPISNKTGVNGDNFMKTVMKMNKQTSLGIFCYCYCVLFDIL